MSKPVAGVEIGLVNGVLTVNPTKAEMESSSLQLTVAGTKDGILMIEGAADFLPEELMVEALKLGGNSDLLASDFSFSFLRILKFFLVERVLIRVSSFIEIFPFDSSNSFCVLFLRNQSVCCYILQRYPSYFSLSLSMILFIPSTKLHLILPNFQLNSTQI